ncbi:DNA-directed RNA polymerases I and III subunit RPAC2, putative [Plasmodium ovale]|uniref:DNA-directed RNA polymerases I and III subunit RPAC2, putative n=1 Tax=Plasmodium ovale TaxID=36330 RepID=A0A1D3TMY2_PLAOA|nr:DNA-directed RNA polymerases I and III subunit RPAC2, putative [Plasmodium ovale]
MDEKYYENLKHLTHATFCFENEDHTLGNCLRYILLQKEGVEFAGYTVPHPTQAEINLRIQTTGEPAVNILMDSLSDLFQVCNIMMTKFQFALDSAS